MSELVFQRPIGRRRLLAAVGLGAAALAAGGALTGCGKGTEDQVSDNTKAQLPTYVPATNVPTPDLPGNEQGAPGGYYTYPKPFRSVAKPPLSGQTLTALTFLFGATPNPRDKNPLWQAVEKGVGATIDITAVSDSDYSAKVNTVIASGKLPDLILNDGASIPDIVPFLEAKCADLTPHLGGDKIKDYPNLAALPTVFWEQCVTNGKLYYLPLPRNISAGLGVVNGGLLKQKAGLDDTSQIRDLDDFERVAKELTDESKNQWAFGATKFGLSTFSQLFAVPNQWRLDGDKLVRAFETPEYLEMVQYVAKLKKAGYFVPGAEGWTKSQMVNGFLSGKTALIYDGIPGIGKPTGYAAQIKKVNPDWSGDPILPFGKAVAWQDNVVLATVMVTKTSDERVKQVLKLADYLASPFGSEEYLLINYGVAGHDYNLDEKGNPIPTDAATLDTAAPFKFLAAPQQVVYDTSRKETVDKIHAALTKDISIALPNPVGTIYSPTDSAKGSTLGQPVSDAVQDFIAGRGSLDAVKGAITKWASAGGDTIRDEYLTGLGKK